MKINEALNILAALKALDGATKIIKDGGMEKAVHVPYAFTPTTRLTLARNIATLSAIERDFIGARNGLIVQISGGEKTIAEKDMPEFDAAIAELLDAEASAELKPFAYGDLKADANPIPPTVIAALMPCFSD